LTFLLFDVEGVTFFGHSVNLILTLALLILSLTF